MLRLVRNAKVLKILIPVRNLQLRTLCSVPECETETADSETFGTLSPEFLDSKSLKQIEKAERKRSRANVVKSEKLIPKSENQRNYEQTNLGLVSSVGPVTPMDFHRSRKLADENERDEFGTLIGKDEFRQRYGDVDDGNCEQEVEDDHHIRLSKFDRKHPQAWYDNRLIKMSKQGKVLEAVKFLREQMMGKDRVLPTRLSYTVVISALAKAGYTTLAFKLFKEMRERDIKAPKQVFTALFNACANCPDKKKGLRQAHYLRDYMYRKDSPRHYITYKAQIKAFAWTGDIQTAFATLDEALRDGNALDQEACSMLLMACVSDKDNGFRHAIKVWRTMLQHGLLPDIYQYNLLVRCTLQCSLQDPQLLNQLLLPPKSARNRRSQLNAGSNHHTLGSGLPSENTLEQEKGFIQNDVLDNSIELRPKEMKVDGPERGVSIPDILSPKPNLDNFVAIKTVANPSDRLALLGGVEGLLVRMRGDKVRPDIKTFSMLLDCIESNEGSELALIERMDEYGVELDTPFCNLLMRKRVFRQDEDGAKAVLEVMGSRQLVPDLHTYATVALTCHSKDEAAQLLQDIEAQEVAVTTEIFSHLNQAAYLNFNYRQWLCQEMSDRGLRPDALFIRQCEEKIKQARNMIIDWDQRGRHSERERNFRQKFYYFNMFYKPWLQETRLLQPVREPTRFKDLDIRDEEEIALSDET